MTVETRVRTEDGSELVAYDFGGQGEPLLFVHATGFHAHLWLPVIERLTDRFHCYAFDERGHGASPSPAGGDFSWRHMGEDTRTVAAALGLDRPKAVGHSGGGAHLVMAEQDHHDSWDALWLFEPVIADPPLAAARAAAGDGNPMADGATRRRNHFPSRDAAYENYASKPPFETFSPEALRLYVDYGFVDAADGVVLACAPADEAAMYRGSIDPEAYERLPEVRIPVHVACGALSTHFPADRLRAVADRLPKADLEVVDGVGHFGPFEQPERIAASVRARLA